jgi:hypothetical protein
MAIRSSRSEAAWTAAEGLAAPVSAALCSELGGSIGF